LTENMARFWAAQYAEHVLAVGNYDAFISVSRPWLLDGETREQDTTEFDAALPQSWRVAPLQEDEVNLDQEVDPKPDAPSELQAWEIDRAYDLSTRQYPKLVLATFACDSFYKLLMTDVPGTAVERRDFFRAGLSASHPNIVTCGFKPRWNISL